MILIDTTVLVYAVGTEHLLREPCRRLLAAHADGRVELGTTVEVLQEFVHVRARRRSRADAVALARSYLKALVPIQTTADDLERGLSLFESHVVLGAFDAVLAAVALERGADAFISADRSFATIPGLRWRSPADPELSGMLSAG